MATRRATPKSRRNRKRYTYGHEAKHSNECAHQRREALARSSLRALAVSGALLATPLLVTTHILRQVRRLIRSDRFGVRTHILPDKVRDTLKLT